MRRLKKEIKFEQPSEFLLLVNRYVLFIMAFIVLAVLLGGYLFVLKPKIANTSVLKEENYDTQERKLANDSLITKMKELEAEYKDIKNNRLNDLDKLKKIIPEGPQIAELFVMADRLATQHGFQLTSIEVSDQGETDLAKTPSASTLEDGVIAEKNITTSIADEITIEGLLARAGIKSMVVHLSIFKNSIEETDEDLNQGALVYKEFKEYLNELESSMRLLDIQSIDFGEIESGTEEEKPTEDVTEQSAPNYHSFSISVVTYYQ